MKAGISRRSLLAGAGCLAAGTTVGQMLAGLAHAQAAGPRLCMTMLFMAGKDAKFASKDVDKYTKRLMPMLKEAYGDSVQRIELRMASGSAMGVAPPILASQSMWINDVQSFSAKLQANFQKINGELDSIVKANRQVQIDRIALELGEPLEQVPDNAQIFSLFYPSQMTPGMGGFGGMPGGGGRPSGPPGGGAPGGGAPRGAPPAAGTGGAGPAAPAAGGAPGAAGPGGSGPPKPTFDETYFLGTYLPKMFAEYGSNAVRRLEATMGMDQGGQPAAQKAAYHLIVRDRSAYDASAQRVFTEMQRDAGKFVQGVFPFFADMKIVAVV
jgi:hypothetical protein